MHTNTSWNTATYQNFGRSKNPSCLQAQLQERLCTPSPPAPTLDHRVESHVLPAPTPQHTTAANSQIHQRHPKVYSGHAACSSRVCTHPCPCIPVGQRVSHAVCIAQHIQLVVFLTTEKGAPVAIVPPVVACPTPLMKGAHARGIKIDQFMCRSFYTDMGSWIQAQLHPSHPSIHHLINLLANPPLPHPHQQLARGEAEESLRPPPATAAPQKAPSSTSFGAPNSPHTTLPNEALPIRIVSW